MRSGRPPAGGVRSARPSATLRSRRASVRRGPTGHPTVPARSARGRSPGSPGTTHRRRSPGARAANSEASGGSDADLADHPRRAQVGEPPVALLATSGRSWYANGAPERAVARSPCTSTSVTTSGLTLGSCAPGAPVHGLDSRGAVRRVVRHAQLKTWPPPRPARGPGRLTGRRRPRRRPLRPAPRCRKRRPVRSSLRRSGQRADHHENTEQPDHRRQGYQPAAPPRTCRPLGAQPRRLGHEPGQVAQRASSERKRPQPLRSHARHPSLGVSNSTPAGALATRCGAWPGKKRSPPRTRRRRSRSRPLAPPRPSMPCRPRTAAAPRTGALPRAARRRES